MIGRILLCLLAVLLLAVGAAVVHTLLLRRRWRSEGVGEPLPRCSAEDAARYGEGLAAMVRIPTVTNAGEELFERLHIEMAQLFPHVFAVCEKYEWEGNLLLRWPGKNAQAPAVLLMGHQDVVPAQSEGWRHPPFDAVIEDGTLYGRGTLDCKCTVYAEFQAVEELMSEGFVPPCDVYLAASVNEETGGNGASELVRELQRRGVRLALALDEGGSLTEPPIAAIKAPFAMVGVQEKGYMDVRIRAKSVGGHSSTPPHDTPMARLAAFICEVERRRPFKKRLSAPVRRMFLRFAPFMPFALQLLLTNLWLFGGLVCVILPRLSSYGEALLSTTCCFTMAGGSEAANVIPGEAWVVANLRVSAHENCEKSLEVLKKLGKKYGLEFDVLTARDASACVDSEGEVFRFLEGLIRESFPEVGIAPYLLMGGTDCRHYGAVTENNIRFSPVYMSARQVASCHAVNENISLWALGEAVRFYEKLLQSWPETKEAETSE